MAMRFSISFFQLEDELVANIQLYFVLKRILSIFIVDKTHNTLIYRYK